MKWLNFFKKAGEERARDAALVERYKEVRKAGLAFNMELVKQLPKAAAPECGKKLGLFKAGTLILNNEDEIAILYDHCLHHFRRAGKNTIERHAEQSPPAPGSIEAEYVEALLAARYSVFRVEALRPGSGVALRDLVADDLLEVVDLSLADTATVGTELVGRILPLPDFNMSSGTLIPLPAGLYEDKIVPVLRKYFPDEAEVSRAKLSQSQWASLEAQLIRVALREGGSDNMFYSDVGH
jgi:hypothetical protein